MRVYKKFSELLIPDFGEEMISLQDDILTFFINCVKDKKYIDNNYVSFNVLQIFNKTPINCTMRKYFDVVEPLIKDKNNEDKAKIKLLVLIILKDYIKKLAKITFLSLIL